MEKSKFNLKNNNGLSLLEIIITVAILSVGITVILQALSYSARVTGLAGDVIEAVFLAEDKIQELEFNEKTATVPEVQKEGKKEKFSWNCTLVNLESEPELYKLDLNVTWERLNREEKLNLTSYLKNFEK